MKADAWSSAREAKPLANASDMHSNHPDIRGWGGKPGTFSLTATTERLVTFIHARS